MWFSVIVCSMARKQTLNRSQSLWSLIAVAHGPWPACFLLEKVPSTVECCWKWAYNPLLLLQTFEQNTTKKGWCSRFFFILQSNIWNFNKSPCPCIPLCWSDSFIQVTRRKNKKRSSLSDGSGRDQDYSPGRKRRSLISTTMTVCAQSLITASLPACNCWATTLHLNSPLSRFGPSFLYCQGDKRGSIQSVRNVCSSREGEKQLVLDSLQTKQGIVRELEMMRGENSAFIIKQDQLQQQRKVWILTKTVVLNTRECVIREICLSWWNFVI